MTITAILITKDEAKNIGRCLASLKGIAEEVIVVDTFSTDQTVAIAESYGAKVVQKEWMGYSETKNFANGLASGNYILSVDADEALSDELIKSIQEVKATLSGAYAFNRRNHYCGKWIKRCGWYPDRKVRLFPAGQAKWKGDFVHETLALSQGIATTFLQGDLLHYSYDSIDAHIGRVNRYSSLAADQLIANQKKGLLLKALLGPQWKFFKMFFLRLGFLDRFYGFCVCTIASYEVFLKYAKAIQRKCDCKK